MELRGLPPYVGIPPFSRCVGLSGTNLGTLRGFSLASVQAPAHGVSRAVNPLHFYPHCSFSAGGGGTPALRRAFLRAEHGRRPPSEAVACRLPFSRLFYNSFFFFSFFYISVTFAFLLATRRGFRGFLDFFAGFSWFATRRGFGLFSTFLGCFVWTVPV